MHRHQLQHHRHTHIHRHESFLVVVVVFVCCCGVLVREEQLEFATLKLEAALQFSPSGSSCPPIILNNHSEPFSIT